VYPLLNPKILATIGELWVPQAHTWQSHENIISSMNHRKKSFSSSINFRCKKIYPSTLAKSTLIILFYKLLKFSKNYFFQINFFVWRILVNIYMNMPFVKMIFSKWIHYSTDMCWIGMAKVWPRYYGLGLGLGSVLGPGLGDYICKKTILIHTRSG